MKEILCLLMLLFLGGVAVAEEIEPSEDVLTRNADGEIVQNGTAIIGRVFFAGALVPVAI